MSFWTRQKYTRHLKNVDDGSKNGCLFWRRLKYSDVLSSES